MYGLDMHHVHILRLKKEVIFYYSCDSLPVVYTVVCKLIGDD